MERRRNIRRRRGVPVGDDAVDLGVLLKGLASSFELNVDRLELLLGGRLAPGLLDLIRVSLDREEE